MGFNNKFLRILFFLMLASGASFSMKRDNAEPDPSTVKGPAKKKQKTEKIQALIGSAIEAGIALGAETLAQESKGFIDEVLLREEAEIAAVEGRYDEAIKLCAKIPHRAKEIAEILFEEGNWVGAQYFYQAYLTHEDVNDQIIGRIKFIAERMDRYECIKMAKHFRGKKLFKIALMCFEMLNMPEAQAGCYKHLNELEKGRKLIATIEEAPGSDKFLVFRCYMKLGDFDNAIKNFQKLKDRSALISYIKVTLEKKNDYNAAILCYEILGEYDNILRIYKLFEQDGQKMLEGVQYFHKKGQPKRALELVSSIYKIVDKDRQKMTEALNYLLQGNLGSYAEELVEHFHKFQADVDAAALLCIEFKLYHKASELFERTYKEQMIARMDEMGFEQFLQNKFAVAAFLYEQAGNFAMKDKCLESIESPLEAIIQNIFNGKAQEAIDRLKSTIIEYRKLATNGEETQKAILSLKEEVFACITKLSEGVGFMGTSVRYKILENKDIGYLYESLAFIEMQDNNDKNTSGIFEMAIAYYLQCEHLDTWLGVKLDQEHLSKTLDYNRRAEYLYNILAESLFNTGNYRSAAYCYFELLNRPSEAITCLEQIPASALSCDDLVLWSQSLAKHEGEDQMFGDRQGQFWDAIKLKDRDKAKAAFDKFLESFHTRKIMGALNDKAEEFFNHYVLMFSMDQGDRDSLLKAFVLFTKSKDIKRADDCCEFLGINQAEAQIESAQFEQEFNKNGTL